MKEHYLLNLYGCPEQLLDNEFFLCDMIENAAEACGATVIETISHHFKPQGVTAISLLAESHISIHTWPEKGEASVDVFTCGDCIPKIACDIIIEQVKSTTHELELIER
jgi:S-adenosylmethionine decarboxylase